MGLKVGIFEDDKELADFLKELLEENGFSVNLHYGLKEEAWKSSDVVLGDFRNQIVNFETLRLSCVQSGIPLIAISGAETTYTPQLIKPFSMAEMQAAILQQMIATPKPNSKTAVRKSS